MTTAPTCTQEPLPASATPQLVVRQQAGSGLVALVTAVAAGSDDDPADCHGMAHLVEHLMFQRAGSAAAPGHAADVAALGGTTNAETHRDHTVFHSLCPAERLLDLVRLEVVRFAGLTAVPGTERLASRLAPGTISAEARVIADEIRGADTFASLWDRSRAQLQRGARDAHGSPEHLGAATPGSVAAWIRSRYRPGRTVLAVVGDVTQRQVDEVGALLGGLGQGRDGEDLPRARALPGTSPLAHDAEGEVVAGFPGLVLAHPMPDPLRERHAYLAHVLLTHLLGRTVLPQVVRSAPEWVSAGVSCGFYGEWFTSTSPDLVQATFAHAAGASPGTTQRLWRSALLRAADAARDPVELRRATNTLLLACHRGADSLVGQAINLARSALLFGGTADLDALLPELVEVSAGDLAGAAQRLLSSPVAVTHLRPGVPGNGSPL